MGSIFMMASIQRHSYLTLVLAMTLFQGHSYKIGEDLHFNLLLQS